jgi:SAM-dependent MidA family methyltransferase
MRELLGSPGDFVLREYGAGTGSLGGSIADRLDVSYEPVEVAGRRITGSTGGPMAGVVLANEFLDALPFHRVVRQQGELRETRVDWDGNRFVELAADVSNDRLLAVDDPLRLPDGHCAEMSLAIGEWLREAAQDLERGYVLMFDYALPQADLYLPSRSEGTARAFRGHHVSSELLGAVGHQDLTAHVNLDALERDARAAGFDVLGIVRQSEFLLATGLDEEYAAARETADLDWESAVALRSAVQWLLDPRHLGGYRVVVLGKGVPNEPPLIGLKPIKPASA